MATMLTQEQQDQLAEIRQLFHGKVLLMSKGPLTAEAYDHPNLPLQVRENTRWNDVQQRHQSRLERAIEILQEQNKRMANPNGNWPKRTAQVPSEVDLTEPASISASGPQAVVADVVPSWAMGAEALPDPEPVEPKKKESKHSKHKKKHSSNKDDSIPAWARGSEELPDVDPSSSPVWNGEISDLRSHVLQMRQRILSEQNKDATMKDGNEDDTMENDDSAAAAAAAIRDDDPNRSEKQASTSRSHHDHHHHSSSTKKKKRKSSSHEKSSNKKSRHISHKLQVEQQERHSQRVTKSTVPRKCHHCRETKDSTVKCQYFMLTGNRCGKYYCTECIDAMYSATFDPTQLHEWHCPSCLGICKCQQCTQQREREEKRSQFLEAQRSSARRRGRRSI